MENCLEKVAKENGNIDVNDLSWKQIIALLNMWDTDDAKRENASFTEMVSDATSLVLGTRTQISSISIRVI